MVGVAELVKDKLVRFFVTKLLILLGSLYPNFVLDMVKEFNLPPKQAKIIKLRYIDGLKFEAIPEFVNCELRNVFILHKDYIDKLVSFVVHYKRTT